MQSLSILILVSRDDPIRSDPIQSVIDEKIQFNKPIDPFFPLGPLLLIKLRSTALHCIACLNSPPFA